MPTMPTHATRVDGSDAILVGHEPLILAYRYSCGVWGDIDSPRSRTSPTVGVRGHVSIFSRELA